jgi:hypothetical protein
MIRTVRYQTVALRLLLFSAWYLRRMELALMRVAYLALIGHRSEELFQAGSTR